MSENPMAEILARFLEDLSGPSKRELGKAIFMRTKEIEDLDRRLTVLQNRIDDLQTRMKSGDMWPSTELPMMPEEDFQEEDYEQEEGIFV